MTALRSRARARLRAVQLAVGVWVAATLLLGLLAPPAAADNCSAFTDCFGVANSAVEAAFGLSLLAVLSLVLDFVPVVGTGKGLIEAATGRDLLTGRELAAWERALGVLPAVGALAVLRHVDVLRGADDVAAGARRVGSGAAGGPPAGRRPGDSTGGRPSDPPPARPGDGPGAGPPAGPRRPLPVGHRTPLDPQHTPLVERYRDGDTRVRRDTAEELGERGAVQHLQETSGRDIGLLRPRRDADVEPLLELVDSGQAWPSAVAYNGRNATNLVWFDGQKLLIVEAKGGSGGYGTRQALVVRDQQGVLSRISQTHPEYPRDVAFGMSRSSLPDGRQLIGDLIAEMYRARQVEYIGVRTGPGDLLLDGRPDVVLEGRFHQPPPPAT